MTADALFDADPYGPGRPPRKQGQPDPGITVQNNGEWYVVCRRGRTPHPLAHKLKVKMAMVFVVNCWQMSAWKEGARWEGAWSTQCGLVGSVVELPEGPVQACKDCKRP